MSLSPIQIYQQQQNPLAQILAGGNNAITGIFDRAIQIGRDMSNKQLQQEQDMMAMRSQETSLMQRRAENLQQNNEDAIKFARGAFESDRKFGVDQTQQAFQNDRVTAQDLFSNQQAKARLGLAQNADARAAEDQKLQVNAANTETARLAAERQRLIDITNGRGSSEQAAPNLNAPDEFGVPQDDAGSAMPSAETVLNTGGGGLSLAAAIEIKHTKSATPAQQAQADIVIANSKNGPDSLTPEQQANEARKIKDQAMQDTKFDQDQLDRRDKAMRSGVEDNTRAFPTQTSNIYSRQDKVAADKKASKSPEKIQDVPQRDIDQALEYDKNRYSSEKASARRMTLPEYLAKGPQDDDSKKAREELWNYVNIGATAPAAQEAGPKTAAQETEDYAKSLLPK